MIILFLTLLFKLFYLNIQYFKSLVKFLQKIKKKFILKIYF